MPENAIKPSKNGHILAIRDRRKSMIKVLFICHGSIFQNWKRPVKWAFPAQRRWSLPLVYHFCRKKKFNRAQTHRWRSDKYYCWTAILILQHQWIFLAIMSKIFIIQLIWYTYRCIMNLNKIGNDVKNIQWGDCYEH